MKINTIFHIFLILISVSVMSQIVIAQETAEIQQATQDARRDVEQNISPAAWASAEFVCGCFAPLYVYMTTPEVPVGALLGKSSTYVSIY